LNTVEFGARAGVKKFFYSVVGLHVSGSTTSLTRAIRSAETRLSGAPTANWVGEASASGLYLAYMRNRGIQVRIARFQQPSSAPEGPCAADARKPRRRCAGKWPRLRTEGEIEIWWRWKQTRSFLYIDECIEAVRRLWNPIQTGPVLVRGR